MIDIQYTLHILFTNSFSGSEWDYVILSLVRSLSKDDLDAEPSMYWLREHLGFLTDEHLMNVGLTRARKGLSIIGKKGTLLKYNKFLFISVNICILWHGSTNGLIVKVKQ